MHGGALGEMTTVVLEREQDNMFHCMRCDKKVLDKLKLQVMVDAHITCWFPDYFGLGAHEEMYWEAWEPGGYR
jgi:hypothetical protein